LILVGEFGTRRLIFGRDRGQFAAPAEKISANGFRSVIDLNLTGSFLMMKAAYEGWFKAHGGAIVNMLAMYVGSRGWGLISGAEIPCWPLLSLMQVRGGMVLRQP
jgi:NAD(P)-dependent dehydrogenase (short-subunit alcohol dehydrogenase family)